MAFRIYSPLDKNEIASALRSTHGVSVNPADLAREQGTMTISGIRASVHFTLRCWNAGTERGWDLSLYAVTPPEWEKPLGIRSEEGGDLAIGLRNMVQALKADHIEFIGRYPCAERILKVL